MNEKSPEMKIIYYICGNFEITASASCGRPAFLRRKTITNFMNPIKKAIKLPDGREITIETGKLAKQADGAVEEIGRAHV